MKKIWQAAAGTFGLIPGLAVLRSGLGVPPEEGMKLIFGGTVEAFGVLSLVLVAVNGVWIRSLSKRTITVATTILAGFAFLLLLAYIGCYQYCVVTVEPRGTVYFPFWNSGDLAKMVSDAGGRDAAMVTYGRYAVYEAVKRMGQIPEIVTNAVLLILYTGVFTTLTWAFGLPATHEASADSAPPLAEPKLDTKSKAAADKG